MCLFYNQQVQFIPEIGNSNTVKAVIQGDFKLDGIHTLYVNVN